MFHISVSIRVEFSFKKLNRIQGMKLQMTTKKSLNTATSWQDESSLQEVINFAHLVHYNALKDRPFQEEALYVHRTLQWTMQLSEISPA